MGVPPGQNPVSWPLGVNVAARKAFLNGFRANICDPMIHRRCLLPLLLLLSFGSGVAALIYEIVWFQMLELVVGSSAVSLCVVLAIFMGGTCLGSLLLPRMVPDRFRPFIQPSVFQPLRVYAAIELAIGVLGIAVLFLIPLVGGAYTA